MPRRGGLWDARSVTTLCITQKPEADELLSTNPLALLLGMLLDQQVPLENAFLGPWKLLDRMGTLDARVIAEYEPEAFTKIVATPPAVHRFHGNMSKRLQALCQALVEKYDGDAEAVWTRGKPTAAEVLKRLKELPGFGDQKAKIFLALLGKQYGVTPYGWRKAAGDYAKENSRLSVADVKDAKTLSEVRAYKKALKEAAGIVTVSGWERRKQEQEQAQAG